MSDSNHRNIAIKMLAGLITVILAYFSVVSTITVTKVDAIDGRFFAERDNIRQNEKNIAVLVEKICNIERMVRDLHARLALE